MLFGTALEEAPGGGVQADARPVIGRVARIEGVDLARAEHRPGNRDDIEGAVTSRSTAVSDSIGESVNEPLPSITEAMRTR